MEDKKCAKVTNILLDKYILQDDEGNEIEAGVRGNVKKGGNILVGDNVEYEKSYDKYVITNILERKKSAYTSTCCKYR